MTFEYKIIPVRNEAIDPPYKIKDFSERRKTVSRKFKRDRRRHKSDRRSSIRNGVIVSLSFQSNKRNGSDRRKIAISKRVT